MKLKWNKPASEKPGDCLEYIAQDSPLQSFLVNERIMKATANLLRYPAIHPPDNQKLRNNGSFRAFTQDSLRISYRIFRSSVHIIRVRHVKQKPLHY